MENIISVDLVVWLLVVTVILGGGMTVMARYYRRPLKDAPLFPAPVTDLSMPLSSAATTQFQEGCHLFAQGQYPRASEAFYRVLEQESACAEAFHNFGLAQANLGNDNDALRALLKASDYYDQQGTRAGLTQIKAQLEQLAERRKALSQMPQRRRG